MTLGGGGGGGAELIETKVLVIRIQTKVLFIGDPNNFIKNIRWVTHYLISPSKNWICLIEQD